jgi:hypothetical protein
MSHLTETFASSKTRRSLFLCEFISLAACFAILHDRPADARQNVPSLSRHSVLGAGAVDADGGIRVSVVLPDSAAERAGLRAADIVKRIGNVPVNTPAEFLATVKAQPAGQPVAIVRGGVPIKVLATFASAPNENDSAVKTLYESISVDGGQRRTLLTLPLGVKGRHPAILIIGGIGCYSIDNATDREDAYRSFVGVRIGRDHEAQIPHSAASCTAAAAVIERRLTGYDFIATNFAFRRLPPTSV